MDSRRSFLRGLARVAAGAGGEDAPRRRPAPSPAEAGGADAPPGPGAGRPAAEDARFSERYARQIGAAGWSADAQAILEDSFALIVGAGALGSAVAAQLAGAGLGRLGIADDGVMTLDRLPGRFLHYTPDVGVPVAHSAATKLGFLNSEIVVEPYQVRVEAANVAGLIAGQDLVIDCSDHPGTAGLLNAACVAAGTDLLAAGTRGSGGWVMSVRPGRTACLRCAGLLDAGADEVALGPVAGMLGSLQAWLALMLLTGREPEAGRLVLDLARPELRRVPAERDPACPDCGER